MTYQMPVVKFSSCTDRGERVIGSLVFVTIPLDHPGDATNIHEHPYAHTTLILQGSVDVICGEERFVANAFDKFAVPANTKHQIIAREPNTIIECIQSIRDDAGVVVQEWNGNLAALGAGVSADG